MSIVDGLIIGIRFTQPLILEDIDADNETTFTISFDEYEFVPGGTMQRVTRPVTAVELFPLEDASVILLHFSPGTQGSIQRAAGDITVAYDGTGTLMGLGGPVLMFEKTFSPTGLVPKNNPNSADHIEISNVVAVGDMMKVYYTNSAVSEHIEICDVVAEGLLIHIDDI